MEYTWDKQLVESRLKEAKRYRRKLAAENYQVMLDILNENKNQQIVNEIDNKEKHTFKEYKDQYYDQLPYIERNIFDLVSNLFREEKDIDAIFQNVKLSKLDLNDKELIDFGHEIITSLDDPRLLDMYKDLTNPNNHRLHITALNDELKGLICNIEGLTIYDSKYNIPYVSIHRIGNTEDLTTLLHEFLHSAIFNIYKNKTLLEGYYIELEGIFGELLVIDYLKNHGMQKYAEELELECITMIIMKSFYVYIGNMLIENSKDSKFKIRDTVKLIREDTGYHDFLLHSSDLNDIFSIQAFKNVTDVIDYLSLFELMDKEDLKDVWNTVIKSRNYDNFIAYTFSTLNYDYMKDNAKQFKEKRKELNKKRVILP